MPMRTPLVLVALLLPLLAACGVRAEPGAESTESGPASPAAAGTEFDLPDVDTLDGARDVSFHVIDETGAQVDLDWWTSCLSFPSGDGTAVTMGQCSDGQAPDDPQSVGSPDEVPLAFDLPGWTFTGASFREHGAPANEDGVRTRIRRTGERTFLVGAPDEPGDYDVDVFGRGPEGDAITTFRWVVR